jgi:hypothetical protein
MYIRMNSPLGIFFVSVYVVCFSVIRDILSSKIVLWYRKGVVIYLSFHEDEEIFNVRSIDLVWSIMM